MNTPDDRKYRPTHEWVSAPQGGVVTIGITDFAQEQLGDVVFVELPEVGDSVAQGDAVAVVESVKTASDIYAPVAGTVVEVNRALEEAPEAINEAPYEGGWIFRLELTDAGELDDLLDAAGYDRVAEDEG